MLDRSYVYRKKIAPGLVYLALVFFLVVFFLPYIWVIASSFKLQADIFKDVVPLSWRAFVPLRPTLKNYFDLFNYTNFATQLANSLLVASTVTFGALLVNSLAAFAFAKVHFPMRNILFAIVIGTLFIPFEVNVVPLYLLMKTFKWIDTYWALIIPGFANGFAIFFLRQAFLSLPTDLLDAAKVDGCSWFRIYWSIALPNVKPSLITIGVITFVGNWNSFFWPLIAVNSKGKWLVQVGIASMVSTYGIAWGQIMAACTLASLPVFLVFILLQRYYVQGVTMSGFKW